MEAGKMDIFVFVDYLLNGKVQEKENCETFKEGNWTK